MGVAHVWVIIGGGLLSRDGKAIRVFSSLGTRIDGGSPFIFNSGKKKNTTTFKNYQCD